jgi:hypothetical protein
MTMFGKILVYVNLAVSMLMAAFAFGLWSNRIDPSNLKPSKDDKTTWGLYAQREKDLDEAWNEFRPVEAGLRTARADVMVAEKGRGADRVWYLGRMDHLRKNATLEKPAERVVFAAKDEDQTKTKKGQVLLDPATGYPKMDAEKDRAGGALLAMAYYDNKLKEILAEREQIEDKHKKQLDEATDLTAKLVVLRRLYENERNKRADMEDEVKRVYPLLVNTKVDAELTLKRQKALKARIEELNKQRVAVGD